MTPKSPINKASQEARWVLLAQTGDREALAHALDSVQVPLYRFLERYCGDKRVAEDLLQESLLQIFRSLNSLREPTLFRAWAYRIATHAAHKYFRKNRIEAVGHEVDASESASEDMDVLDKLSEQRDFRLDLDQFLPDLPTGPQLVLSLHYLEGFPLDDVAAILGVPLGTVKSRLNQGLKLLRVRINQN